VLQVERGLCILGHHSHAYVEVRALRVGHGLKALLPHRVSLIAKREERDRHRGGVSKVAPTCCIRRGGVRRIAFVGTPGDVGPWNTTSHP
jgi:hypothetical protein